MNWKNEAIEKLRKYDAMRLAVQNIPEEMQRLELEARAIRSANTQTPHAKSADPHREERLLSNITHRQELRWALEGAKSWLKTTNQALSALTPEEKMILTRLFIYPERGAVDRLCGDLGIEQSSVYRRRDRALRNFTLALYGITEE